MIKLYETDDEIYSIDSANNNSLRQRKSDLSEGFRSASNCAMLLIQPQAAFLTDEHTKYGMFCKWLKLCESQQSLPINNDIDVVNFQNGWTQAEKCNEVSNKTPLIRHSSDEDDDEFLDTESSLELLPTVPTIIEEYQPQVNLNENYSFDVDNSDNNMDIDIKLVIPKLLNMSPVSSSSDITALSETSSEVANIAIKIATHKKGRAPPIPVNNTLTETNVVKEPYADGALLSTNTIDQKPLHPQNVENKEKKKKNLFGYIPGIFKPISPSNSSRNVFKSIKGDDKDDHPHETIM